MLIHDDVLPVHGIVLPRRGQSIVWSLIGYTGCPPVADHLNNITHRHLVAVYGFLVMEGKVYPIFEMMLVSALVMKPGG